jgi:hypothetical protein
VELIAILTGRPVIAGLAIIGAMLVMAAGLAPRRAEGRRGRIGTYLSAAGYAVTFLSIALFIAAGFLSGR